MTPRDLSALTPLLFHHINPHGAFESSTWRRNIPIDAEVA
jgi:hypothetical protein